MAAHRKKPPAGGFMIALIKRCFCLGVVRQTTLAGLVQTKELIPNSGNEPDDLVKRIRAVADVITIGNLFLTAIADTVLVTVSMTECLFDILLCRRIRFSAIFAEFCSISFLCAGRIFRFIISFVIMISQRKFLMGTLFFSSAILTNGSFITVFCASRRDCLFLGIPIMR